MATNGNDYGIIYLLVYVILPLKANTVAKTAINELKLGYVFWLFPKYSPFFFQTRIWNWFLVVNFKQLREIIETLLMANDEIYTVVTPLN